MAESQTVLTRSVIADSRQKFCCPIFGEPQSFVHNKLPTYKCVLKCCFEEQYNLSIESNNKFVSFSNVALTVANKIKLLYDKASIPSLSKCRIVTLINSYYGCYTKIRKSYKRDKYKELFKSRLDEFKAKAKSLFDCATCKCTMSLNCTCNKAPNICQCDIIIDCSCEKEKKIPVLELRFMYLQRNYRMGKIGPLDTTVTKKLTLKAQRKDCELNRVLSVRTKDESQKILQDDSSKTDSDSFTEDECEYDEFKPCSLNTTKQWQMRVKLGATALNSDRLGVSDRATALIASSVLQDFGIITETDPSSVIDKSKIRRGKSHVRKAMISEFKPPEESWGLYFDGRRDDTFCIEKVNHKQFRRTIKEEHYSLVEEPGSVYIGHVSPSSSSATDIAPQYYHLFK